MAANTSPVFILAPLTPTANTQIANDFDAADTTDIKDIVEGATDGTIIQDLIAVSDDTSAVELKIWLYDGSAAWQIGQVNVPIGAGTNVDTPSVSLLNVTNIPSLDKRDDGMLFLADGQKLQVSAAAAVTADKLVTVVALGGNL